MPPFFFPDFLFLLLSVGRSNATEGLASGGGATTGASGNAFYFGKSASLTAMCWFA